MYFGTIRLKVIRRADLLGLGYPVLYWGLVTPYGDSDLGKHWLRQWLVAWRHQAITWTHVDLSSEGFCGILQRTVSQELLKVSIQDMSLKKTFWKLFSNLPEANELNHRQQVHGTWKCILDRRNRNYMAMKPVSKSIKVMNMWNRSKI